MGSATSRDNCAVERFSDNQMKAVMQFEYQLSQHIVARGYWFFSVQQGAKQCSKSSDCVHNEDAGNIVTIKRQRVIIEALFTGDSAVVALLGTEFIHFTCSKSPLCYKF